MRLTPALLAGLLGLGLGAAPHSMLADAKASATVQIGDTTYSAWTIFVPAGGTVTWTNVGGYVHTATMIGTSPTVAFDTGGLAPGQSATVGFNVPGVYFFSSAPDCLNGNNNPGFNCAGPYQVVVTGSSDAPPAQPVGPAANPGTVTVYIDDNDGFQPNTLTLAAGQSINFVNRGSSTHNASSDRGLAPWFNTGGLAAGQSKVITFSTPGSYPFHSSTEPIWGRDAYGQTVITGYVWNGLITVR
jgi:plastocyanin